MPEPAAGSPALDGAVFNAEIDEAGEFDAIAITTGSDVADSQPAQDNMVGGAIEGTTVVDVDAIDSGVADDEVVQFQEGWAREMDAGGALKHRGMSGVGSGKNDGKVCFPLKIREVKAAGVCARSEQDTGAGLGLRSGLAKLSGILDERVGGAGVSNVESDQPDTRGEESHQDAFSCSCYHTL